MPAAFVPMKLPCTVLPVALAPLKTRPLALSLPEMTLPAPGAVPPIVLPDEATSTLSAVATGERAGHVGADEVAVHDVVAGRGGVRNTEFPGPYCRK